jgi:hypothetical protein
MSDLASTRLHPWKKFPTNFDTANTLIYVAELTQNEGHQSATQIVVINILERDIHYEQKNYGQLLVYPTVDPIPPQQLSEHTKDTLYSS